MKNGALIISLDFELFWGVRDSRNLASYGSNILGVRKAIPAMLDVFDTYGVKATFAAVGLLFCSGKEELMQSLPVSFPAYRNRLFSLDGYFEKIGKDETEDPYHFGASLIRMIGQRKQHEIATHTFGHYYCLEEGQTPDQFRDDLRAAKNSAARTGVKFKSIVFPRNQYSDEYLRVASEEGLTAFRGNENSWLYKPRNRDHESRLRRALRLLDSYMNVSGYHVHIPAEVEGLCNIPSSRFLRPYNKRLATLEQMRLRRIMKQMSVAAEQRKIFHLWWHPHNFGSHLKENIFFLENVLRHYRSLQQSHGFTSMTMNEVSSEFFSSSKK